MLQSVERRRRGEAKRSGDKVREECGCEKREERGAAATRGKRVSNPASIKTGCGSALRAASQRRKEAQRRREASGDEEAAATRSEERRDETVEERHDERALRCQRRWSAAATTKRK